VVTHAGDANVIIVDTRPAPACSVITIPRNRFNFSRNVIDPASGADQVDSALIPQKLPMTYRPRPRQRTVGEDLEQKMNLTGAANPLAPLP